MRILVIDDSPLHQASARQTLAGHELTVIGSYDEAYEALGQPDADWETVGPEISRLDLKNIYDGGKHSPEEVAATRNAIKRFFQERSSFDVVLCDLLMPAGKTEMGPAGMKYVGQEMPVGFALALMAVVYGAKHVAVVTDAKHHDHPASVMLDRLDETPFSIDGAKVGFYHSPLTPVDGTVCRKCKDPGKKQKCYCLDHQSGLPRANCEQCNGVGKFCWACNDSGKAQGKDWGKILADLVANNAQPLT